MSDQTVSLRFAADTAELRSEVRASADVLDDLSGKATTAGSDVESAMSGATEAVDELTGANQNATSWWDEHSTAINATGLALGGTGAALEAFNRSHQDTRFVAERVANSIGMEADEVLGLATEVHDATRNLDEMVAMMEIGAQQGIRDGRALQDYALFWDTVGDATGESAGALADASSALRTVGIAAGNESEALAAFGYVAQNTTGSVGEFLRFLERTGPELMDMGVNIDQSAALLGILEHEFGMSGRTARSEFRAAVSESDGTLAGLLDTLGVTEAQFADYTGRVAESSEVIADNAAAYKDTRTPMQELQARLEALSLRFSWVGDTASMLSPVLMGAGGVIIGLNQLRQLAPNLTTNLRSMTTGFSGSSRAMRGMAIAGGALAAVGIAATLYDIASASGQVTVDVERAARATSEELLEGFRRMNDWDPSKALDAFQQIAEGSYSTAKDMRDAWEAAGNDASRFDEILADVASANEVAAERAGRNADATRDLGDASSDGADGVAELAGGLSDMEARAAEADAALNDLLRSMDDHLDAVFGSARAARDWEAAIDDLTDGVADHGSTLDRNTEAGRRNEQALERLVEAGNGRLQQMQREGATAGEVRVAQQLMAIQIMEVAEASGISRDRAREYANALLGIPTRVSTLLEIEQRLVDTGGYARGPSAGIQRRARGGPLDAGDWSWVGEEGPELIFMPRDGYVFDASESAALAAGSNGGTHVAMTGSAPTVTNHFVINAASIDERVLGRKIRDSVTDGARRGMAGVGW